MSWTHFFDSHFSRIAGNDVCFSIACKNHGVTMSWKDQHVRMSWKDLCFRMFSKVESFQMYLTHFFEGDFFSIAGDNVSFSIDWKTDGVTMSWKDQHVRMSWKDLCFRMYWKVESFQMYLTHFFEGDFFSISRDSVCYRTAWKNYGVTMSSREESLRISCKHFGFRMSSRLFHECLKTMLSRRSERKNLYGCLGMTYV